MKLQGQPQSENVEIPAAGTRVPYTGYSKFADAPASEDLSQAIDKAAAKDQWMKRSRVTKHVNKGYEPLPTGD